MVGVAPELLSNSATLLIIVLLHRYYTMLLVWTCALLRPPYHTQVQLSWLVAIMYSFGSVVIFGDYDMPEENGFRTANVLIFGLVCCAKATLRFENDDKQKFQDARDLASKLEVSHLAEQEKDARIAAECRTVESERLLTAFLCHEIR